MKDPWDPKIRYKVLRDADFYVLTYPKVLVRRHKLKRPTFSPFSYKKNYRAVATYVERDLPSELAGWVYDYVHLADENASQHFGDYTILEKGLDLLPQVFASNTHAIVTETIRDFLIQEDPEGCQFFAIRIVAQQSGREAPEQRFAVLPRRFFKYEGNKFEHSRPKKTVISFANDQTISAFYNMNDARLFAKQFPIFNMRVGLKNPILNRATFHKMKELGFTGLVELQTEEFLGDKDDWECVGHIR